MYPLSGASGAQPQIFRQHPLVKLALPGLPWLAATVLLGSAALYLLPLPPLALILAFLALIPAARVAQLYLAWWAYSIRVSDQARTITERSGILNVSERVIPLSRLISVSYQRPWWATTLGLDVADATVEGAIGETLVLRCISDFSRLWAALQARGRGRPGGPPTGAGRGRRGRLGRLALAPALWIADLASRWPPRGAGATGAGRDAGVAGAAAPAGTDPATARRPVSRDPYVYGGRAFARDQPSRAGFLAFCEQFLLAEGDWTPARYRTRDARRRYYPTGLGEAVAERYLDLLRRWHVLLPGPQGRGDERLSGRVRTIEDIARLVPDDPGQMAAAA